MYNGKLLSFLVKYGLKDIFWPKIVVFRQFLQILCRFQSDQSHLEWPKVTPMRILCTSLNGSPTVLNSDWWISLWNMDQKLFQAKENDILTIYTNSAHPLKWPKSPKWPKVTPITISYLLYITHSLKLVCACSKHIWYAKPFPWHYLGTFYTAWDRVLT